MRHRIAVGAVVAAALAFASPAGAAVTASTVTSPVNGAGFDFDEVTITDFYVQVPDAQSDTCLTESVAPKALAVDAAGNGVLEAGETATVSPATLAAGTGACSTVVSHSRARSRATSKVPSAKWARAATATFCRCATPSARRMTSRRRNSGSSRRWAISGP